MTSFILNRLSEATEITLIPIKHLENQCANIDIQLLSLGRLNKHIITLGPQ
jgi:hypothetical protein